MGGIRILLKGFEGLNSFHYQPKQTYLPASQIEQVVPWVTTTNPAKTTHVKAYIQEQFNGGIRGRPSGNCAINRGSNGSVRPKQPGEPPGADEQRAFVTRDETMKTACEPGTVLLFGDAMHVVHQNEPAIVGAIRRLLR